MAVPLFQNFGTLVANQAAAIQTQAKQLIDFGVGAILRAMVNANAAVGLWLQGLALQTMALSRFASSYGTDADSWGLDWGYFRLGATYATGFITYGRFTPTNNSLIPVGAIVSTPAIMQTQFEVIEVSTYPNWSPSQNGYTLNAGTPAITVPVQAVVAGSNGNVIAGAVNLAVTSISGVDYVTNALQMVGGSDAETDAAFKAGFPGYLASLARGTVAAITAAVEAIQVGTQCSIMVNFNYAGQPVQGYLTIIVDDGSGDPDSAFLANAAAVATAYAAAGVQVAVYGPTIILVDVSFTITTAAGYDHPTLVTIAGTAVETYIDALLDNQILYWSEVESVIQQSSLGVLGVYDLLINGGTVDLVPPHFYNVYKAGVITGT